MLYLWGRRSKSLRFDATSDIRMVDIRMKCGLPRIRREDVQRRDFTINGMLFDPADE